MIFLIITAACLLGVLIFFVVRIFVAPLKISSVHEHVKQGNTAAAIRGAKQILAKNPCSADAHYLLARAYSQDAKTDLALMEYQAVNRIGNFSGICKETVFRTEAAALYTQFGQKEEALKEYLLLIELEPREAKHYYEAGRLFEERNKARGAAGYYKKALELNPRFSEGWFAYGQLMYRAKRAAEAKDAFQKAIKVCPDNFKAYFYMGCLLKDAQNFKSALSAFENARKDPDFKIKVLIERGSCLLSMKNYEKAKNELERAIKLSESSSDSAEMMHTRYFLSVCYEHTRNLDKAIEQWETLYKIKKNFRDVAEKLSRYQELRSDDRMKDFITASPQAFEAACMRIVNAMNLSVTDSSPFSEGIQITAVERSTGQWQNIRKFPKYLRILRSPDPIDLPNIRKFHEQMKKAGVDRGYLICSSSFTRSAIDFAESRPIDIISRDKLQELLRKAENTSRGAP